ncbi:hypothetical protein V5R04_02610 [Jonesiaceae bacterium BS-20]|uniref:Flagellar FliJ protein n=1 Tax=Jonesiaceae bacterium BS-20 TaxID=3120821 RepID=A0AAU7DXW7_9MICO
MSSFRLARLLQLRQMRVDKATHALALSHRRANQAEDKVERAQSHVLGADLDVSPAVWQAVVAARLTNMALAKEAVAAAQVARAQTAQATETLDRARQQAKPIEKLQEKFYRDQATQDLAAQALILDEVGQNMFRVASQSGEGGNREL